MSSDHPWWQAGIVYQIYPRSFQDTNDDGVGDLRGILSRLDYLESLGIDALWLSPIYPSPMHDFGYDVADYVGINPLFGTMADFDTLLDEAHRRGMKLVLDLVPNHTSDEHPWFIESRSSRESSKRDWYIWRDPAPGGGPPNNWLSFFGGPAWTMDDETGQYYLHQFVKHQPELNYRNPQVLAAMQEVIRFWLDKGVDGFRVDVIWLMLKDEQLRDEPPNPSWNGVEPFARLLHLHTQNVPGVHDLVRGLRSVFDEYEGRAMIGEIYLPIEELVKYYGSQGDECHLPFNFHLVETPWRAADIRDRIRDYEAALPREAWPNWVLGNHDQHRIASRIGSEQARVAQMLLLTLRGTPTCYYGDEIGMVDVPIPLDKVQDPPARNQLDIADIVGRDPERTPMQWSDTPNSGFTSPHVEPWLPLAEDASQRHVAEQLEDPRSMLALFRALTKIRRKEAALSIGDLSLVEQVPEDVLAYTRSREGGSPFLVVLNLGKLPRTLDLSGVGGVASIAVSTSMTRSGKVDLARLELGRDEGLLLKL